MGTSGRVLRAHWLALQGSTHVTYPSMQWHRQSDLIHHSWSKPQIKGANNIIYKLDLGSFACKRRQIYVCTKLIMGKVAYIQIQCYKS
ncbi:hypothetical protein EB796_023866 [Bugula neritina]|uniref:Uncharacterized protein n=1 Tax=Bugula neritina TaxID=10212 RepID=A0A7J7IV74_BUGNE|nr:hypothetical protein EB796_023866 [Bugula neritina]